MPRPISARYLQLRQQLVSRIEEGYLRPGDRFYSNRALAKQFGVSYQTAHRLAADLERMGLLTRTVGSGSYVSGAARTPVKADLIFNERAKRGGSFGAHLLGRLTAELERRGTVFQVRLTRDRARLEARTYPVLWECPETLGRLVRTGGFGLLLNRMPPEGLAARFIDSVGVEDRSGGRSAAEVLARQWRCGRVAVLAGPRGDPRSERRVEGFLQVLPGAVVVHARSWEREAGLRVAGKVLEAAPDGIFCVNDRLAQALWEAAAGQGRAGLRVIGFDNAPVAEELGLTTIAIPWEEFVEEVAVRIGRRLDGDNGTARQVNLVPRILYR